MSRTTVVIIVVIVIVGLGLWAWFWQMGRRTTEELRSRAESIKTEVSAPGTPSEAPPPGTAEPGTQTEPEGTGESATPSESGG